MYRTVGLWVAGIAVFCLGVMAVMWVMPPGMVAPPSGPPPDCDKVVADVLKDRAKAKVADPFAD